MSQQTKIEIVPASEDDLKLFYDEIPPTLRAWSAREDGEAIALFGLARRPDGRWHVFFEITERARRYKVTIVRNGRMVMNKAREMGLAYVYAVPEEDEPMACRWLSSLGFEPDPRSAYNMRWTNDKVT
jgi:hypothetical protein